MMIPFSFPRLVLGVVATLLGSTLAMGAEPTGGVKTEWSRFATVGTITAEVRSVDDNSVTLRVYWTEAEATKGRSSSRSRGGRNSSPIQRAIQQARQSQSRMKLREEHKDYDVRFFADTKVTGVKPKDGSPASPAHLEAGMVVSAHVIRDRTIPVANVTEADFHVKSLHVTGRNPNYSPDSSSSNKPGKNKKK